jgi:hypothetical protein
MKHVNRNWIGEFRKVESLSFCKLFFFLLPVLLAGCGTVSHLVDNSYMQEYVVKDISAADPSLPGSYKYRTYFYGKGDDHHRKEYGGNNTGGSVSMNCRSTAAYGFRKVPVPFRLL